MEIKWDVCGNFVPRRDYGRCKDSWSDSILIGADCKAQKEGRLCKRRGRCVIARDTSWCQISVGSFKKAKELEIAKKKELEVARERARRRAYKADEWEWETIITCPVCNSLFDVIIHPDPEPNSQTVAILASTKRNLHGVTSPECRLSIPEWERGWCLTTRRIR
jgi:hypothetical protein